MRRAISVILIVMGIILLYWGYDLQQRLDMQLIREVTGEPPEAVWQYYITGTISLLLGGFGLWKFRG